MAHNWVSGILGLGLFVAIVWLIRRDHMHSSFAVWWLIVAACVGVLGVFPGLVDAAALGLGISYSPTLVFLVGFVLVIMKLLKLDIGRSNERVELRMLVERVAILESEIERLRVEAERR